MVGENPAVPMKQRFDADTIALLLKLAQRTLPLGVIREIEQVLCSKPGQARIYPLNLSPCIGQSFGSGLFFSLRIICVVSAKPDAKKCWCLWCGATNQARSLHKGHINPGLKSRFRLHLFRCSKHNRRQFATARTTLGMTGKPAALQLSSPPRYQRTWV